MLKKIKQIIEDYKLGKEIRLQREREERSIRKPNPVIKDLNAVVGSQYSITNTIEPDKNDSKIVH